MSVVEASLTIGTQLWMSHVFRGFLRGAVPHYHHLLRECLMECVAAAEMCGVSYELGFVYRSLGLWVWSACVFLLILWRGWSWGRTTACPYSLLEEYVEAGANPYHVCLKILAQITGALISCRWVRRLWTLDGSALLDTECSTDLQVSVTLGFLIEALLTCACRLFSRTLGELKPKFSSLIESLFTTSMVILAFDYSGGYFNPVLATGLKWSCRGNTNTEYILVYWAGSILGSMLSLKLWSATNVRQALLRPFLGKLKDQ